MARINLTQEAYIGNVSSTEGPIDVTTKGYLDVRISTASTTAPTAPVTGTLWVDTSISPYVLKVFYVGTWITVSNGVASTTPTINKGNLLGLLASTFGTASVPATFTVAGTNMTAGILVTAPPYFEVSLASATNYSGTVTVGSPGTISTTTVYVRLTSTAPVGSYDLQNIVLTSAGAITVNVTTSASGNNVTAVASTTPTITVSVVVGPNGIILPGLLTSIFGTASNPVTFPISGANMTAGILVTAPTGLEVSLASGSGYANTITVGAAGTIASTPIYVRLAATALVGNYNSLNIVLSSNSATSVNVVTNSIGNSVISATQVAATLLIDPAGADNSVLYTANTAGTGGNAISVAYAAPVAQATTTVAVVSNAITVTPGTKARMTVTGATTFPNPTMLYGGTINSQPFWSAGGWTYNGPNNAGASAIFYDGTKWIITSETQYTAELTSSAQYPDGLTGWTVTLGSGLPTVASGVTSAQQVINEVNRSTGFPPVLSPSAVLVTASVSGPSTGAVAAVAATYLTGGSSGGTVIDNGYTTPTSNGADFYVAPNGTDYYVQPTIATNAYTFNNDILTFQGDTLTFAA